MYESFTRYRHIVYVPVAKERILTRRDLDLGSSQRVILSRDYRRLSRLTYYPRIRRVAEGIEEQVELDEVDLIHAHSLFVSGGAANSLKHAHGLRYVVTVRSTDVNKFFRYAPHLRKFGNRIMEDADRVVFLSPAHRNAVLSRYVPSIRRSHLFRKTVIVPNGIDSFWHNNRPAEVKKPVHGNVRLLYVGQFIRRKNVPAVLDVANVLASRGWNVTVDLVGHGPGLEHMRRRVRNNRNVRLHGLVTSTDTLLSLYREADVFVMLSFEETFGLVYIEAMSQGLPIIFSKGQGIDGYFAEGEIGYAVDPCAPEQAADRIEALMTDYEAVSQNCLKWLRGSHGI